MSFRARAQEDFLRWLIAQLLEVYGDEGGSDVSPDLQIVTGPRVSGQGSVGAKGRRFTPRVSNLLTRPGATLPTVMVEGRPVALGNTGRRAQPRPRRAYGFSFAPPPPPEGDLPDQPVTHEGVLEFRPLALDLAGQPQAVVTWLATPIIGDEDGGVSG